jgi:Tfp pilus assembly protein PilF
MSRRLLFRGGDPVPVGQRGAALLAALLARSGEVLDKQVLMDAAWPDTAVEEANLSVQVSALRRQLGRRPDGGEWIATVQRIGYRFAPALASDPSFRPTLGIDPVSGAGDFVEDLTIALTRYGSISVVAEGSVTIPGYRLALSRRDLAGRIRTNVRLVDATAGSHIWAQTFDEQNAGLLIDHVAALVDGQVQMAETARSRDERPGSASAYDLYLRARWALRSSRERDNAAAHLLLQQALRLEPENVQILAGAAETLHHRISVGWHNATDDDRAASLEMAQRGIELAGNDAAVLSLFGMAMYTARHWDAARVTVERALALNGGSSMALVNAGLGSLWLDRIDAAEAYCQRAVALGPGDPNLKFALGFLSTVERRRGNYETSMELAQRCLAIAPGFSSAHWNLVTGSIRLGRKPEARRYLQHYRTISPATVASIREGQPVVHERLLGPVLDALAEAGLPEG